MAGGLDAASSMTVSFSTTDLNCPSILNYGLTPTELSNVFVNDEGCNTYTHTSKYGEYISDCIHHVTATNLIPSTKYYYRPSEDKDGEVYSFNTGPIAGTGYPMNIAVLGDLGQTPDSIITENHINDQADDISFIIHAGDMSYADCDDTRWDSWFDQIEFLSTKLPW